jgi:cbb3-type cytochrome oxidase maturation protein
LSWVGKVRISSFGLFSAIGLVPDFHPAMSVIVLLICASLALALAFLFGFVWAVRTGQFEDTYTPSLRMLSDEESGKTKRTKTSAQFKHLT